MNDRRDPAIDRSTSDDLVSLATDVGPAPMHAGAILVLGDAAELTLDQVRATLGRRLVSVPRLRRRLVPAPRGGGRPVWIDDVRFDVAHHVHAVDCPSPGGTAEMFDVATEVLAQRLPRDRPLWRAVLVTSMSHDRAALILVMHHVLADGIGGLAVLANLVDGTGTDGTVPSTEGPTRTTPFPRPAPSAAALRRDAARTRREVLRRLPHALRQTADTARELHAGAGGRLGPTTLLRPTGATRRLAVVHVGLDAVRTAARTHDATINDVALVAIAGALGRLAATRGEHLPEVVISVPVSARRRTGADELGNAVGAVPVRVPTTGDPAARLRTVTQATRRMKDAPRGASASVLGPVFRVLARIGLFRRFIERQRLVHTFVTNLRGPDTPLAVVSTPIRQVIPLASVPGDVTVSFAVLSYAGTLGVTLLADPRTCPEVGDLRQLLEDELGSLVAAGEPSPLCAPRRR